MTNQYISVLFAISFSALFCILGTPFVRNLLFRQGVIDVPSKRRINKEIVPRGGGIIIYLSFILTVTVFSFISKKNSDPTYYYYLVCSFAIFLLGLIDDCCGISAKFKLFWQIICSTVLLLNVYPNIQYSHSGALIFLSVLFFVLLTTNSFNLIDGLDGLSTGISATTCLGLIGILLNTHNSYDAIMLSVILGSCIGFLRYNYFPAKIYLGDSGSYFLGFSISYFTIRAFNNSHELLDLLNIALMFIVPYCDVFLAVWRRAIKKAINVILNRSCSETKLMNPDLEHLHHRIMSTGLDHRNTSSLLVLFNSIFVLLSCISIVSPQPYKEILTLVEVGIAAILIKKLAFIELWDTGRVIVLSLVAKIESRLKYIALATIHWINIAICFFCSYFIVHSEMNIASNYYQLILLCVRVSSVISFFNLLSTIHTKVRKSRRIFSQAIYTLSTLCGCCLSILLFKEKLFELKLLNLSFFYLLTINSTIVNALVLQIPNRVKLLMEAKIVNKTQPLLRKEEVLIYGIENVDLTDFTSLPENLFHNIIGINSVADMNQVKAEQSRVNFINENAVIDTLNDNNIKRIVIAAEITLDLLDKIQKIAEEKSIPIENNFQDSIKEI